MRLFTPPPPPPPDAVPVLEELVTHRVREKLQGELRQDRQELLNKIDSAVKSLTDKFGGVEKTIGGVEKNLNDKFGGVEKMIGGVEKNLNIKIDATKTDTSLQAAAYALGGATLAVSTLGFFFEKKVAVVNIKPAPT